MKRNAFFGLALILACCGMVVYVVAQQTNRGAPPESKLTQAYALISLGQPQAARDLLATIPDTDPDFAASKHFKALALAAGKDRLGFLKALEKLPTKPVALPPEVETDLAAHRAEALFFYRNFEEALPRAKAFLEQHADSTHASAVQEYLLAGLFERGLKKTFEASRLKEEADVQFRWTDGRSNLVEFLALATASGIKDYQQLPGRSLREDLLKTRVILGDEAAALGEIPGPNAAEREKFSLLCALLYPKIQSKNVDQNLQRMTDFLREFPQSKSRVRVQFEMANVALQEGERLATEARNYPDPKDATAPRAAAASYLELAQGLFPQVAESKDVGMDVTELREARIRMMRVFYAQDDWANLSDRAAQLLVELPDEKDQLVIKLYLGAGLTRDRKLPEAARVLHETLAIGFRGNPSYDGLLVSAAGWRFRVARQSGDEAGARRVVELVRDSKCYDSRKRTFLNKFEPMLAQEPPPLLK